MIIEAHILAFNESETIHLTIKHYQSFCSNIVIWDNFSTDSTREIAKSMGCTVKTFGKPGELSDRAYMELKNECWKKKHPGNDRRDWVIVCDADEILFADYSGSNLINYCLEAKHLGYTICRNRGWNVFSHNMPKENWLEITNGHPDENYSKTVIFDPKAITDINFRIGAHVSSPKGDVNYSNGTFYLLHYRNVGGPQRLIDRHKLYRGRLSQENKERGFGIHYTWDDETRVKEWEEKYECSAPLHFL